jgi:hypothetical protein
VILWPFRNPPEFRGTEITILAGTTAKIQFHGIPGIDWIPLDSSRNTRRTVKNSKRGRKKRQPKKLQPLPPKQRQRHRRKNESKKEGKGETSCPF